MKAFNKDKALRKLRIRQNKGKYIKWGTIGLSVVILIIGIVYFSFARFESNAEFTIIDGKVGNFSKGDMIFAFNVDGTNVSTRPNEDDGYYYINTTCTNGVSFEFTNTEKTTGVIDNFGDNGTKCTLNYAHPTVKFYLDNNESTIDEASNYTYLSSKTSCNNNANIAYDENSKTYVISNVTHQNTECEIHYTNPIVKFYLDNNESTYEEVIDRYLDYSSDNTCTNNAIINYDRNSKKYTITNVSQINTICKLYFKSEPGTYTIDLKVGDTINYNVTGNEGAISEWIVIKEGSNPELVSKKESPNTYKLEGKDDYYILVSLLNNQAASYGTNSNIVSSTRHMGYSNQDSQSYSEDTGYTIDYNLVNNAMGTLMASDQTNNYYLASRSICHSYGDYCVRYITTGGSLTATKLMGGLAKDAFATNMAIRPIITLQSTVKFNSTSTLNTYDLIQ